MTKPSLEELQQIGTRVYEVRAIAEDEARRYTQAELTAAIRIGAAEFERLVLAMSPGQLTFRLPGEPEGRDASGDEEHFDVSEIATHLAMGNAFYQFAVSRVLGGARPAFPRAPRDARVTGKQGSVLGRGGWSGLPAVELVDLVRNSTSAFLSYMERLEVGEDQVIGTFGELGDLTARGWLLLAAIHYAMHIKQVTQMQAHPDFPRA